MSSSLASWFRPPSTFASRREPARRRCQSRRLHVEELERRLAITGTPLAVNVPVTTDPGVQQMPTIAADPADPKHLVTAYMDYSLLKTGYAGIGVKVSHDSGSTWSQETSIALPAGFDQGAAYPTIQFDGQGHVFVSFMAATMLGPQTAQTDARGVGAVVFQSNNGIFVARSDDGGTTWNAPVAVVSHLYDGHDPVDFEMQPSFAIDTYRTLPDGQPNPYYGSLYETWGREYPAGQFPGEPTATGGRDIMFAVSRDRGQTWQIQLQPQPGTGILVSVIHPYGDTAGGNVEGAGGLATGRVSVGPEGDIYVSYAIQTLGSRSATRRTGARASPVPMERRVPTSLSMGPG